MVSQRLARSLISHVLPHGMWRAQVYDKEKENAKGLLVVSLHRHKRGRPTALGAFIVCVKIVHAVAKALLLFYNVTIAKENRERAIASKPVSRSIFYPSNCCQLWSCAIA